MESKESCIFPRLKAKNLVLSMQDLQCHTSILKKMQAKVIQFLCIFLFCVEVLFLLFKANYKIWGLNIFQYTYLYTAYTDDATSFLKNKNFIRQIIETLSTFSQYSCLKFNNENCKIVGTRVLKSVKVAVCW